MSDTGGELVGGSPLGGSVGNVLTGLSDGVVRVTSGVPAASGVLKTDETNGRVGVGTASPAVALHVQGAATTVAAVESLTAASGFAIQQVKVAGNIVGSVAGTGAAYVESANVTVKTDSLTVTGNRPGGLSLAATDAAGALRLYSGGSAAANLRALISAAGVWTLPGQGVTASVAGAATSLLTVAGLAGNTARAFRVALRIKNANASDSVIRLRPNGVTTNLKSQAIWGAGGAPNGFTEATTWYMGTMRASAELQADVNVWAVAGTRRYFTCLSVSTTAAGVMFQSFSAGFWDETTSEITSFDVFSDTATALAVGSSIVVTAPEFFVGP